MVQNDQFGYVLNDAEKNYAQLEMEWLSLVFGVYS